MRGIRDELEACLKQLELFQGNYKHTLKNKHEGHLYCNNSNGKTYFSLATSNNEFKAPRRRSINNDREMMRELLACKVAELTEVHVS